MSNSHGKTSGGYTSPKILVKEAYVLRYERTDYAKEIRKKYEAGEIKERRCNMRKYGIKEDGFSNTITTVQKDNYIVVKE